MQSNKRRNLQSDQSAAVAAEYAKALRALTEIAQKEAGKKGAEFGALGGRGNKNPLVKDLTKGFRDNSKRANAMAAERTGTNRDYTTKAAKIEKEAPEVFQGMKEGIFGNVPNAVKVAALPEQQRAAVVEKVRAGVKPADAIRETKRAEVVSRLEDIKNREVKALSGEYDVIVIDPPWPMQKIERDVAPNQTGLDYPVMQEEELHAMKIPAAKDCHMWLWTTHKFLPMALRLLQSWDFKYVCTFVWHKPGGFQPYGLPQFNCEFAIYARRGTPEFIDTKAFPVCFSAPRGAHSEKPEMFYEIVRRVTAGRRADMFNRREIAGFERWGNEA
jgi:N6-adenosine-specific RNA methylase IME4